MKKTSRKDEDIESGPWKQESISTRFAKSSFMKMLNKTRLQQRPNQVIQVGSDKHDVYRRLMDQLDAAEETQGATRYTFIELVVFSGLLASLVCTLKMDRFNRSRFLHLRMWQYVTMVMVIFSGLSIVRFITFILSLLALRWWRINKYAVYFIRQLKSCLDVTLWFWILLFAWYAWFRPRLRHVHGDVSLVIAHEVTRFLISLSIGSFLWLLKNILYFKLEADLHYDQLFERIRMSVVYLHGLQIIHNKGRWRFLSDRNTKKELMKMLTENKKPGPEQLVKGENIWMDVMAMDKKSVPIWILRRLAEEYIDQLKHRPLSGNSDITKDDHKIINEANKMFRQLINKRFLAEKPDRFRFCNFNPILL